MGGGHERHDVDVDLDDADATARQPGRSAAAGSRTLGGSLLAGRNRSLDDGLSPARVRRTLNLLAIVVGVIALVGMAVLWPRGRGPTLGPGVAPLHYVDASVIDVHRGPCPSVEQAAQISCQFVDATLQSGTDRGRPARFQIQDTDLSAPSLHAGDKVVLLYNPTSPTDYRYSFADFQRKAPIALLVALFAVVVLLFGRWHGLRALAGLVASLGVVVVFLLPSLLRGHGALPVALVATTIVAFAALYLAHGIDSRTTIALVGTLLSLAAIALLAVLFVSAARLTGLMDESSQVLRVTTAAIDPRGLIIAGAVVGALGVLDDVTVTQVAAVAELRAVNPALTRRELYRRGIRIGRDHVSSTVNTLVLAYAGASLPLLLYFLQGGQPWSRVITREVVAIEVVRTLVGSIGLVMAVPVTTALAALASERAVEAPAGATTAGTAKPSWEQFTPRGELDM